MWRSLEGQAGRGLSKVSGIYLFGLIVSCFPPFSWLSLKKLVLTVRTVHIYPRG